MVKTPSLIAGLCGILGLAGGASAQGQGYLLDAAAKGPANAVCLDGTPGGYYLSAGSGDGASKWYIHMEGGGWCRSAHDCLGRSSSDLGSSSGWPANQTAQAMAGQSGAMRRDPISNPQMHDWNHVWIMYCDGNSFTGANASATAVPTDGKGGSKTLHWRGSAILDAVIDDLLGPRGVGGASDVVVGGGSAGGLAVLLHCDRWTERLLAAAAAAAAASGASGNDGGGGDANANAMRVRCLADSGFFLDHEGPPEPPRFPDYGYHAGMVWAYAQMNSSAGVDATCAAHYGPRGEGWKCNFAQYTTAFSDAPVFARQSTYDSWQTQHVLGFPDNATLINEFGANLTALLHGSLLAQPQHAAFVDSCSHHCGEWDQIRIDGQVVHEAFWGWYNGSSSPKSVWTQGKAFPCDSCCKP